MSLLRSINLRTQTEFRDIIFSMRLRYGYLTTLAVLAEYEEKEYYYACHWLLEAIKISNPAAPYRFSKAAIDYSERDFNKRGRAHAFDEHLRSVPERSAMMQQEIESHWAFMRY